MERAGQDLGDAAIAIEAADFSGCECISAAGVRQFAEASRGLRELNLAGCIGMDRNSLVANARAPRCVLLVYILEGSAHWGITVADLFEKEHLTQKTRLLEQQADELRSEMAHTLRAKTKLQVVDLSWCTALTDRAAAMLGLLPLLHHVNLSHCAQMSDEAVRSLAKLTKLSWLSMSHCIQAGARNALFLTQWQLTYHSCRALKQCEQLAVLDLSHCPKLTDVTGFRDRGPIASLNDKGNLQSVNLDGCPLLTDSQIERLSGAGTHHELRITSPECTGRLTSEQQSSHRLRYSNKHHEWRRAAGVEL